MYRFLWFFFLYAFFGWCTEVAYAALNTGRFVNRGFLNGPICPIYGFGAVAVLALLNPLRGNLIALFLGSMLLASALEWLTGFVLEKLFHQRWWDYSDQPFNLNGYICLKFSVAWGIACLFVTEILHPSVVLLVGLIPHPIGTVVLVILCGYMALDLTATVRTIAKINLRLQEIDEAAAKIRALSDEFGESLAERVLDAAEKGADLKETVDEWKDDLDERLDGFALDLQMELSEFHEDLEQLRNTLQDKRAAAELRRHERRAAVRLQLDEHKQILQDLLDRDDLSQRRILRAFPNMHSTTHAAALERLRRRMAHRIKKD